MNIFSKLPDFLQDALKRLGITEPTPVQQKAILPALEGRDVLATAQTGTGKTFAFLLPLVVRLTANAGENALILSPTRELAQQTRGELEKLTDLLPSALIIGGDNIHKQYADLRRKPRVIIATPGRLLDHIGRKSVDLKKTSFVVLDETDRMLDMGFLPDMKRILSLLPLKRQTLLLSATLPDDINTIAHDFLTDPVRVKIGSMVSAGEMVLQEIVYLDVREKLPQLLHELNTRAGSILVFTRTKRSAERLAKDLKRYGQKANALHGELRQNRRRQVLDFFRTGAVRVLVATDLASRGLDVAQIAHVINYDLPQCPEDYIHRIGRTGRAGETGNALSFICDDGEKWREICKVTKFAFPVKTISKTIEPLPAPKFVAEEESAVRRPKKVRTAKKPQAPSPYTERAKELLKTQEVPLPQAPAATKKPKTFHKAVETACVLEAPENLPFKKVKVGASRRALRAAQDKSGTKKQPKKFAFQKFIKRKKRK
jgi:superfamily II DNA/RNA helicase